MAFPSRPSRTRLCQPNRSGTGGNASIAALSASSRSTGAAPIVRTVRRFARAGQSSNWAVKSAGDAKWRAGMNDVSNQPLRRSTTPLDSGSFGGSNTTFVAKVPAKAVTPSARRRPLPMPASLS